MKKIAFAALASAAALALSACHSEPTAAPTEAVTDAPDEVVTGDATDVPSEAASEAL
ncbi:hypothetical protein [Novosphingobium sp. BL-52-GroH]|uniref:hypothetical protein n=1 Tax=Novosphingobium sp. BL-52-GroH TaxID=3349877 RepID=UPI00384CCE88